MYRNIRCPKYNYIIIKLKINISIYNVNKISFIKNTLI